jgi:ATP-binding cassette, subfamily B, bacterial
MRQTGPREPMNLAPLRQGLALMWQSGKGWVVLQAGLLLVQGLIPVLALYLLKAIVDAVSGELSGATQDPGRIGWLIAAAGGVAIVGAALRALSTLVTEVQALRLGDLVNELLHRKSVEIDLQFYESPDFYDTLHRAQTEAPSRPARIVAGLVQIGLGAISLVAVTGLLLTFHWLLVVILLGAAIPGVWFKTRHSRRLYQWIQRNTIVHRRARYLNGLMTAIQYAKEIRLFNLGRVLQDRYGELRRQIHHGRLNLVARRSAADLLGQVFAVTAVFGSIFFISREVLAGSITIGAMVMYFGGFQRAQDFFRQMLDGLAGLYEDNLFLADFKRFLELKPAVVDPPTPRPFPRPLRQGIAFERVTFRYPGTETDVLQEINLEIQPGEHVALVGANGSGKTTLVKLLCRLYDPTTGSIRLDGTDLKDLSLADLRTDLAVVFQDYAHYHFSARENIWLGNVALPSDSDRIIEAATRTGADSVIKALPSGYETVLGRQFEKGAELSLGQWQKVALARAFLRDSQIIVLDEPTAALDPRAEAAVFDHFHELAKGRTAILISHRLSTVRRASRIYVMADGHIVETGAHDELLQLDGVYADLYQTQARPYR